jgi:hypothetical protein
MAFNVDTFRAAMALDGARPNLFEINLRFPTIVQSSGLGGLPTNEIRFLANSTQLPPSIIGVARTNYFGREVKFPGDRVFPDWSINIINDETFLIKNAFEIWSNVLNNNAGNIRNPTAVDYRSYTTTATVTQFGKDGTPIKAYGFAGLFPSNVDGINVAWNANDQVEEFGVTFSYQYWEDLGVKGIRTTPYVTSPY